MLRSGNLKKTAIQVRVRVCVFVSVWSATVCVGKGHCKLVDLLVPAHA